MQRYSAARPEPTHFTLKVLLLMTRKELSNIVSLLTVQTDMY